MKHIKYTLLVILCAVIFLSACAASVTVTPIAQLPTSPYRSRIRYSDPMIAPEESTPTSYPYIENTPTVNLALTETQYYEEDTLWMKQKSLVTLESNGRTITVGLTNRFFIFLDDEKYPLQSLEYGPGCYLGWVSNGSLRGPKRYPLNVEATRLGTCELRNGDFSVTIIVAEPTPFPSTSTVQPVDNTSAP